MVLVALPLVATLTASGPASADHWTETTDADFAGGTLAAVTVDAGDLRLAGGLQKEGVVLDVGPSGSADSVYARSPFVLRDSDGTYKMWYGGLDGSRNRLLYATSTDGRTWTKEGIAIDVQQPPFYFDSVVGASVLKEGATYQMWFHGGFWGGGPEGLWGQIYHATSSDGRSWSIDGVALGLGPLGAWDDGLLCCPWVMADALGGYRMYYTGWDGTTQRIGLAFSDTPTNFTRYAGNPIINLGPTGAWDDQGVQQASVVVGQPWRLYYAGYHSPNTWIGVATSWDGNTWFKSSRNPFLVGDPPPAFDSEQTGGPSYLNDSSGPLLYYNGYDGSNMRIGLAHAEQEYRLSGSYQSRVFDSGSGGTSWTSFAWNATLPSKTNLTFSIRAGNTPVPGDQWTEWRPVVGDSSGAPLSLPRVEYVQYSAELGSLDGNETPRLHDVTVTYGPNAPPTALPISPTGGTWINESNPVLRWTVQDPEGDPQGAFMAEASRDLNFANNVESSGVVNTADPSWTPFGLADGTWYWRVRVEDIFGAWSEWAYGSFRVDTLPPSIVIRTPSPLVWIGSSSLRLNWTAADVGSGLAAIFVQVDLRQPVPLAPTDTTYLVSGLADGPHAISVRAVDAAGNVNFAIVLAYADTTPPALTIHSPGQGAVVTSGTVDVSWTATDDGSGLQRVEVRLDGGDAVSLASNATSYRLGPLSDGEHTFTVTAIDRVGNRQTEIVSFRVDTNFLSASGPVGPWGLAAVFIIVGAAIFAAVFTWIRRRRRGGAGSSTPGGLSEQGFK